MCLVIFYYFFTKRKQNKTKKIIKYYQPRQLVVGLLWEMNVGIISHQYFGLVVVWPTPILVMPPSFWPWGRLTTPLTSHSSSHSLAKMGVANILLLLFFFKKKN
jgi:hypothetical protein